MAIRQPPDDYIPRVVRSGRVQPPRVVRYEEPRPAWYRRVLRFLLRPYIALPLLFATALIVSVFTYYWVVFSARIDNLLRGEVFTRSAGIYAAPKQIRPGQSISEEEMLAHLKRAGYVERSQQADSARGRYAVNGDAIEIDPGADSVVDNARPISTAGGICSWRKIHLLHHAE